MHQQIRQEEHLGDRFSHRRRVAIIVTLGLLTALGPFTIDMYLPAFPSVKLDLSITDAQVQVTLSATTLGFALGQLIVGPLSDRLGRRWPLLVMSALHVVSSLLVAVAPTVEFLTVMRAFQGIGAAGGAVVAMAMARDLFSGRRLIRMMSQLALINGLAPIVAPILGSWLLGFTDWRGVFWVLMAYGLVIVALVAVLIVETRPASERTVGGFDALRAAYGRVLGDRLFVGVWIVAAMAFGGLFSYVSSSSVLLQEGYGLSARGFGMVFAICSVGVFIGVQIGSRFAAVVGPQVILIIGTTTMVVAAAGLLLVHQVNPSLAVIVPFMFIYTTGFGSCMPSAQVLALQGHRADSGVAASLMGAGNMIVAACVGPIIGQFDVRSPAPMGTAMLVLAVASSLALWVIVRPRQVRVSLD
ncbi:multidrug effflux MFS transporter [Propionibacteriaceae bacterium G1746]|uniref:multidrug effflux MFS transporter n=1 Tax=Aestuariimicrobium sp. G57 TaxID=3418485 RepID=UPI003C255546